MVIIYILDHPSVSVHNMRQHEALQLRSPCRGPLQVTPEQLILVPWDEGQQALDKDQDGCCIVL